MGATSILNHQEQTQPGFSGNHTGSPIGEAHGGYTSCALASYFFLQGYPGLPNTRKFDFEACLRWVTQSQALPIEGGGFRGRTNKLVDGCYIWWCGGLLPLLEAMLMSDHPGKLLFFIMTNCLIGELIQFPPCFLGEEEFPDLCDRQALQEYILLASQEEPTDEAKGGLKDKPGMAPDMYHTHYILSGLSVGQHKPSNSSKKIHNLIENFQLPNFSKCTLGNDETETEALDRMKGVYSRILGWKFDPKSKLVVGPP
jgi:protein farnesyltransferase subunit beta